MVASMTLENQHETVADILGIPALLSEGVWQNVRTPDRGVVITTARTQSMKNLGVDMRIKWEGQEKRNVMVMIVEREDQGNLVARMIMNIPIHAWQNQSLAVAMIKAMAAEFLEKKNGKQTRQNHLRIGKNPSSYDCGEKNENN